MSNTKTAKLYELADAVYELLQVCENGSFRDIRISTAGDNMDDRKIRVIVNLLTTHFTVIDPQVEQKPNQLPAGTIVFLTDSIVNISVDDVSVQIVVDWDTSTVKLQVFSAKDAADVVNDNDATKQYVVDDQAKGSTVNPLTAPEEPSVVFELSPQTKFKNEETADKALQCLLVLARSMHAQCMKIAVCYSEDDKVSKRLVDGYMVKMFDTAQWQHKKFPMTISPSDFIGHGPVHVLRVGANSEGEISVYILRLNPLTGHRTFELLCLFGDADKLTQYTDDELELAQLRAECLLKGVELITMTPPSIQSITGFISGMQTMPPVYEPTSSITADEWVQMCKRANKIGSSLILTGCFGHKPLDLTTIRMSATIVMPGTTQIRRVVFNISAESLPTGPQWGGQQQLAPQAYHPAGQIFNINPFASNRF